MTGMNEAMPELCPRPIAVGTYDSVPDVWFYLSEFVDMMDEIPDMEEFAEAMAELHKHSPVPGGQFGWPYFVYAGAKPLTFPLSDSWEHTFSEGMQQTFGLEEAAHGPDEELTKLKTALVEKVIPRLLRPLQTGGRNIVPTLVHGDLWHGNVALDADTGAAVIFDPTAMGAHHECRCR